MNLKDIEEPILVNDILHVRDNMNILEHLFTTGEFMLGINNPRPKARLEKALLNEVQHAGFTYATKENLDGGYETDIFNNPLNLYAFVIVNQLSKKLNFDYQEIERVYYNYYCRDQFAVEHTDSKFDDHISIIYNFHTTDGGTIILGKKYQDRASQAKIFKSNWLHSSWACEKDKGRVSLNIKLKV